MSSNSNLGEVFAGGATTSQHVDAQDDDHFENTTFKLKRTRSLGLLDEFIQPEKEQEKLKEQAAQKSEPPPSQPKTEKLTVDTTATEPAESAQSPDDDTEDSASFNNSNPINFKSPELLPHDDTDIVTEPSRHVDYLSHQWDVSDISKSWRYVISKRKDVANSARLENASWRTWAQRRCNLKTISPEVVNWSKDSDVTWLYGPILKDEESFSNISKTEEEDEKCKSSAITTATSAAAGDISIPNKDSAALNGPKPILKRRTVQDMMISHSNLLKLQLATNKMYQKQREKQQQQQQQVKQQQLQIQEDEKKKEQSAAPEFDDFDAISAKLNSQYKNISAASQASSQSNSLVNLQNLIKKNSSGNLTNKGSGLSSTPITRNTESTENEISGPSGKSDEALASAFKTPGTSSNKSVSMVPGDSALVTSHSPRVNKPERHIHFNDEVRQCISVDLFSDDDQYDNDYDSYDDDDTSGSSGFYYDGGDSSTIVYGDEDEGYTYKDFRDRPGTPYPYASDDDADHIAHEADHDDDEDNEDDDDEDDEGGFFLKVKSPSTHPATIPFSSSKPAVSHKEPDNTEDTDSISTDNSKVYRTIQLLPSTSLNYGSSDEDSTEENPYTSSLSHNVDNNSRRGYDYYYDYNTVYEVDPNHAIYGNKKDIPEVCDVPENITVGSNFDYQDIEEDYARSATNDSMPIINPSVINSNNVNNYRENAPDENKPKQSPFQLSDSENDSSDSDEGTLSIGARRSSQSLAQSVFSNGNLTPAEVNESHYPQALNHPQPVSAPVSSINPRHSSTSLSKQSTSSNSLSQSFFGGGLTKQKPSSTSLSESFFNAPASSTSLTQPSNKNEGFSPSPENSQRSLSNTQRKASPLPPHTTSTNAFSGNTTPPLGERSTPVTSPIAVPSSQPGLSGKRQSSNTFMFDSESESEDEFVENVPLPKTPSASSTEGNVTSSYASLSQVAGKNGIRNVTPDASSPGLREEGSNSATNLVGQAKGLANHFLGGWKQNPNASSNPNGAGDL